MKVFSKIKKAFEQIVRGIEVQELKVKDGLVNTRKFFVSGMPLYKHYEEKYNVSVSDQIKIIQEEKAASNGHFKERSFNVEYQKYAKS